MDGKKGGGATSSLSQQSTDTAKMDNLKDANAKLRGDLEAERKSVKLLRREKTHEIIQVREQEQNKASVALKDLKTKLRQEKSKELEVQKEALVRKFESEVQKITKQKEAEIAKLRADVKRCQDELQEKTKRGLSGSARDAFEAERSKLLQEVQSLRTNKRQMEETLKAMSEADKQKSQELKCLRDSIKSEVSKAKKEADVEVRKLLEELKSKDRHISQMEKDTGANTVNVTKLKLENESMQDILNLTKEAGSWERRSSTKWDATLVPVFCDSRTDASGPIVKDPTDQEGCKYIQTEMAAKIQRLEGLCVSLAQDKTDLLTKIKEMEKKHRTNQDKNKKFLEKNMELTTINRDVEDKLKQLHEDNSKLKSQVEKMKRESARLGEQLSQERLDQEAVEALHDELQMLHVHFEEQDKTIMALKTACVEKDRRIELLAHRRRKQHKSKAQQKKVRFLLPATIHNLEMAAGIKETYYGYDEDTRSVESEFSSPSCLSSSRLSVETVMEDDVFEDFTREEFEKNYQRLCREHLDMERSYSLLQSQVGGSHVDPLRDIKDTGWLEEKDSLTKTLRMLKDKIKSLEEHEQRLHHRMSETTEQSEVLEFRILELEELNEKLVEEKKDTVTFKDPPTLSRDGVLQMVAEEKGVMEIKMDELKEKIHQLKYNQDGHLSCEEKVVLLQARAMLDVADKKLKEHISTQEALHVRIKGLEADKAELLSAATGVSSDVVLEYEETRNTLLQAELKIKQLDEESAELKKAQSVHDYTDDVNQKTESRYRDEIAGLRRQLSSSSEGREYESVLFREKYDQVKDGEKQIKALKDTNSSLQEQVKSLQSHIADLEGRLTDWQDTHELTECDKETSTQLHNLKTKITQQDKSEQEMMEKNRHLEGEIVTLRKRLAEYETVERDLTESKLLLQEDLERVRGHGHQKEAELDGVKAALRLAEEELHQLKEKPQVNNEAQELALCQEELRATSRAIADKNAELEDLKADLEAVRHERDSAEKDGETESNKDYLENLKEGLDTVRRELVDANSEIGDLQKGARSQHSPKELCREVQTQTVSAGGEMTSISQGQGHEEKDRIIEELTVKVQRLEEDGEETESQLQELEPEKHQLDGQVSQLEAARTRLQEQQTPRGDPDDRPHQTRVAEDGHQQQDTHLQEMAAREVAKVRELEARLQELAAANEELTRTNDDLHMQLENSVKVSKDIENQVTQLKHQEDEARDALKEADSRAEQLQEQLKQTTSKEQETRAQLGTMEKQKTKRIESLLDQVNRMESNKIHLTQTIEELTEVEYLTTEESFDEQEGLLVARLRDSEQRLKDQLQQMEADEKRLRERLNTAEQQLKKCKDPKEKRIDINQNSNSDGEGGSDDVGSKVTALEAQIKQLLEKEAELLEKVYQMQLENQELQEHIDELLAENDNRVEQEQSVEQTAPAVRSTLEEGTDFVCVLKERVAILETEKGDLKDQLLRSKLETVSGADDEPRELVSELQQRIVKLEAEWSAKTKSMQEHQRQRLEEFAQNEGKLQEDLLQKENQQKVMTEKINMLEQSERKLMEQIEYLEENQERVTDQLERLRKSATSEVDRDEDSGEVSDTIMKLETREKELLERLQELESRKQKDGSNQQQEQELERLREKVDILIDTEEKLVDRLQEQEEVEQTLRQEIEHHKQTVHELNQELFRKDSETAEEEDEGSSVDSDVDETSCLKQTEMSLRRRVTELEASQFVLQNRITSMDAMIREFEKSELMLTEQIHDAAQSEASLRNQNDQLDKGNKTLKAKMADLETMHNARQMSPSVNTIPNGDINHMATKTNGVVLKEMWKSIEDQRVPDPSQKLEVVQNHGHDDGGLLASPQAVAYSPLDARELQDMSREAMISKIHELDRMEQFHRAKIVDLSANLATFRHAVEDVAVTMETDAGVRVISYRPKTKDSEFEFKVQDLVRAEVSLKLRVLELEKRDAIMKAHLHEAETSLREQEADFKQELEELEAELDTIRKSEAKLKNKLKYGSWGKETPALAKIQHLEELVFDLEASERKLKRQLHELRDSEQKLQATLDSAQSNSVQRPLDGSVLKDFEDKDKIFEIGLKLRSLETSESELKEKVSILERDESQSTLLLRVAELERTEKGLKRRLELHESQQHEWNGFDEQPIMLDSPEAILRQRIKELEKMEHHLKQQIIELEGDREEMHDIARKDKNSIHELNVHMRELQLSEKNLKEHSNHLEVQEDHLNNKVDDMADRIEELEALLKKLQVSERRQKLQLDKYQSGEKDSNAKLESALEDLENTEQKLNKKVADLEVEKKELQQRVFDLTDRVGDLEGGNFSLKQRLKTSENHEASLKDQVSELEGGLDGAKNRCVELENLNEGLTQKSRDLADEKARLLYEVADMESKCEDRKQEVERQNVTLKALRDRVAELEVKRDAAQRRMDELTEKEVERQTKLAEADLAKKQLQDQIARLEAEAELAAKQLQELEAELDAEVSSRKDRELVMGNLQRENGFLQGQTDRHLGDIKQLEEENETMRQQLNFYQKSATDASMATIPQSEVDQLRAQVALLDGLRKNIAELEKSETNLKETLAQLKDGKNACGHEEELQDLKKQIDSFKKMVQAHGVLQLNYEDVRNQLKELHHQIKDGKVNPCATSSKSIQVRLAETFTLKQLSPDDLVYLMDNHTEFKKALRNLGARHPEAYEDFVRNLQPSAKKVSQVRVRQAPLEAMAQAREGYPQPQEQRPFDTTDPVRKQHLLDQLVEIMPMDDLHPETSAWGAIEGLSKESQAKEEGYWNDLMVDRKTDDMMLSLDVFGLTDDSSSEVSVEVTHPDAAAAAAAFKRSPSTSSASGPPPPLPSSVPPASGGRDDMQNSNDSYYLPGSHQMAPDSADEASDINDEDDGALPPMFTRGPATTAPPRAKSLERDSDFSEGSFQPSSLAIKARRRRGGGKSRYVTGSLESIPDSGTGSLRQDDLVKHLKDKMQELEKQVQIKEKELEESRACQSELEKKSKDAEDTAALKAKLQEMQQQLEEAKNTTAEQQDELLQQRQQLQQLQGEISRLERLTQIKNAPGSSTLVDPNGDLPRLKQQLQKTDKELGAKKNESDRLSKELRKWQIDSQSATEDRKRAERDLERANDELETMKGLDNTHKDLKRQFTALLAEHNALVDTHQKCQRSDADKSTLQRIVLKLRGQVKDLDRIELERQDLQKKLDKLQEELKQKAKSETQLTQENSKMRHQINSLEQLNAHLQEMEKDFNKVRSKYEEMAQMKTKALTMITPLRAQLLRLSKKCRSKDTLIAKLASELRQHSESRDLVAEADREQSQRASEEYDRPLSPLTQHSLEAFEMEYTSPEATNGEPLLSSNPPRLASSRIPRRVRHLSSGSSSCGSDIDALLDPNLPLPHHSPGAAAALPTSPALSPSWTSSRLVFSRQQFNNAGPLQTRRRQPLQRSLSSDDLCSDDDGALTIDSFILSPPELSYVPVTQLSGATKGSRIPRKEGKNQHQNQGAVVNGDQHPHHPCGSSGGRGTTNLCKAVKDYNPELFSRSGHPRLELPLKEGDNVRVSGPVDDQGYCEAEVNGKVGLVPANYLLTIQSSKDFEDRLKNKQLVPSHTNSSPEQILQMHSHLQSSHVPNHNVPFTPISSLVEPIVPRKLNAPSGSICHPAYNRTMAAVPPVVSPRMPHAGSHPAFQPQLRTPQPNTPSLATAKKPLRPLPRLPLATTAHPCRAGGPQSPPPIDHTKAERAASPVKGPPDPPSSFQIQRVVGEHSVLLSWASPRMDELARSNAITVKGYKIVVDNRDQQTVSSPHMTKALIEHLNLRRPHSFSIQSVGENGLRSRTVDTMYTELAGPGHVGDGLLSDHDSLAGDGDASSVMSSTQCEAGDKRVFLAVYDYPPSEHSPRLSPGLVLAFKAGDIIVTYGKPRDDGFYCAKVHGKRGLVPSSFVEEVALLRSHGKRSISSSSLASQPYASSVASSRMSSERSRPQSIRSGRNSTPIASSRASSGKVAAATV